MEKGVERGQAWVAFPLHIVVSNFFTCHNKKSLLLWSENTKERKLKLIIN